MYAWEKGTDIALWGTGKVAKKFYYSLRDKYHIIAFFDNKKRMMNFSGFRYMELMMQMFISIAL